MRWVKKARANFFDRVFHFRIHLKKLSSSTGPLSRKTQSKDVQSEKLFLDCVRMLDLGFCRKGPFSSDKPYCVKNNLSAYEPTLKFK